MAASISGWPVVPMQALQDLSFQRPGSQPGKAELALHIALRLPFAGCSNYMGNPRNKKGLYTWATGALASQRLKQLCFHTAHAQVGGLAGALAQSSACNLAAM